MWIFTTRLINYDALRTISLVVLLDLKDGQASMAAVRMLLSDHLQINLLKLHFWHKAVQHSRLKKTSYKLSDKQTGIDWQKRYSFGVCLVWKEDVSPWLWPMFTCSNSEHSICQHLNKLSVFVVKLQLNRIIWPEWSAVERGQSQFLVESPLLWVFWVQSHFLWL